MLIFFHTLGCKVNQYETQSMRELFQGSGHCITENAKDADIIILNSCTVTAESDRKTRQLLRRFRKENPEAVTVLTGCMPQAFPEAAEKLEAADIIIGNTDPIKTVETALSFKKGERTVEVFPHKNGELYKDIEISEFSERTRAYMKIEDGCDRFCSYCIIPKARGSVRSRGLDSIKAEAERLAKNGFSEIVLVGINLSAYGKDENFDLCDAVSAAAAVDGILRVRLGSLEPDHITDGMLEKLRKEEKFCPQFHLSLQSGCDETLKRMNRHYDTAFYADLISRIRKMFPDAGITTDIMVGFAGETEEEFKKSLAFAEKIGFSGAHIFMYSRRLGTVAAALPAQVENSEKERRSRLMIEATNKSANSFAKGLVGKALPVLFERQKNGYAEGYTASYTRVRASTSQNIAGKLYNIKIIGAENDCCIGELTKSD